VHPEGPRIYNLFPLLAGPMPAWQSHFTRARRIAFNWIFLNPVQKPGASGSIYSILDYYALNPLLVDPAAGSPDDQLRNAIDAAHDLDLRIMMDLVVNHTASDSPLIDGHPAWFKRDSSGAIIHPGAMDDTGRVSWTDLATVDNAASSDRESLWTYWLRLVSHYASLGIDGFRCDAAYQVPPDLWQFLISSAHRDFPALQ
jgi:starch synthase (maltosyl-transferring)